MNKIICDICGSTYSETADRCPICGSSREFGVEGFEHIPEMMPEFVPERKKKHGFFSTAAKMTQESLYEIDDLGDDPLPDLIPEADCPGTMADGMPKHRVSYFVVILLSVLIGTCVIASVFLLFRYYLPHQFSWETEPRRVETENTASETTLPAETAVPCKSIVLTSGVPEITRIGQYWLLHVLVMPEDTTDQLTFTSSDESVVTVTAEGRLCSVGEGTTTVVISCGAEQILCQVTVKLPGEGPGSDTQTEQTEEEAERSVETEAEAVSDGTEETEEAGVILKLKQTDISFTKKGVTFLLQLDCDLRPEDVTWITLDPDVAICHDGLVTVLGKGTTRIVAQYGDQQVYCIIRCDF